AARSGARARRPREDGPAALRGRLREEDPPRAEGARRRAADRRADRRGSRAGRTAGRDRRPPAGATPRRTPRVRGSKRRSSIVVVEIGSTIGNYEVLQKIGQGAMGAVYMARHPVIGKPVALKIIHPNLATNDEMVSRFFNEARAVAQIGHPNIVDVQDFGQTP